MVSNKLTPTKLQPYPESVENEYVEVPEYSAGLDLSSLKLDDGGPSQVGSESAPALDIQPGDIVIAIMGVTGSGKSTFISHFSRDVPIGHTLVSCTSAVGIYKCQYNPETKIYFVDTPGFDDTYKSDTDILREIADWISRAYSNKIQLSGIVYLHRILDVRLGGSAMKNLRMFKKLCGDDALSSVVLATTWWSGVDAAIGVERERQLKTNENFWAGMIAKGSTVFRQDDDEKSAKAIVDYLIELKRPIELKIVEELNDNKTLDQTSAGIEVDSQLAAQKKAFEVKLQQIGKDMRDAMREKDEEFKNELLLLRAETQAKLQKAQSDTAKLQADKDQLRRDMDAQLAREIVDTIRQVEENKRRIMASQHDAEIVEMQHANEIAEQQNAFKMEKLQNERRNLEKRLAENESASSCSVM